MYIYLVLVQNVKQYFKNSQHREGNKSEVGQKFDIVIRDLFTVHDSNG